MSSKSNHSKSSRSPSPRKKISGSRSPQKKVNRQRSNSVQKERIGRTPSSQHRRSPGRGPRRNADLIPKSAKLFVTNIDSSYTTDEVKNDLQKQFSRFGEIVEISVKTKNGSANSFAFINYKKAEDAESALNGMKGKEFKGKELKVEFGKGERKQQDRRADKCYICHKEGHFARECRYSEGSRDHRDSRQYGRRKRYSPSSQSSRSPRKRSYDRQRDRNYRRRDQRSRQRDYRRSPERGRQYRNQRRSPERGRQYRNQRSQRY